LSTIISKTKYDARAGTLSNIVIKERQVIFFFSFVKILTLRKLESIEKIQDDYAYKIVHPNYIGITGASANDVLTRI